MLSIEESKKILNKNGANYSDEEIKIIRDYLYELAQIDYELFKTKQRNLSLSEENKTKISPTKE